VRIAIGTFGFPRGSGCLSIPGSLRFIVGVSVTASLHIPINKVAWLIFIFCSGLASWCFFDLFFKCSGRPELAIFERNFLNRIAQDRLSPIWSFANVITKLLGTKLAIGHEAPMAIGLSCRSLRQILFSSAKDDQSYVSGKGPLFGKNPQ
jgi:hypothetical protein